MTLTGRLIAIAAAFAALPAELAVADGDEYGGLTFAEGTASGERVRMIAGEVDGKGVLYAEYYTGAGLRFAVPYTRVFTDGEETNVRALRSLALRPQQTTDGFAFTAFDGATPLQCTALLWADATVNCSRGTGWIPPGDPSCAAAFQGHDHRFQCNGLRGIFTNPQIPHDELLGLCTGTFRWESYREGCIRDGYNAEPARFRDTLAACSAAYRTEDERNFCFFFSFAPAEPKDRVTADVIRACTGKYRDDRKTTECVFLLRAGRPPADPNKPIPPPKGSGLPTDFPTLPLAIAKPPRTVVSGARIDVTTGKWREFSLRATGGMVATEPLLFIDAFGDTGELRWSNNIDRVTIGKQVRALREATELSKVKLSGDVLTFRAVIGGKPLQCRADASSTFARCR